MLHRILSNDLPRSRWLACLLVLLVLVLAFTPFIFPGVKALNVAAKVLVFIVLVASFDLLLGYTGIVSFAHTMFFGIGAYGIAVATTRMGPTWEALAVGVVGSLLLSFVLALVTGLFSLKIDREYSTYAVFAHVGSKTARYCVRHIDDFAVLFYELDTESCLFTCGSFLYIVFPEHQVSSDNFSHSF